MTIEQKMEQLEKYNALLTEVLEKERRIIGVLTPKIDKKPDSRGGPKKTVDRGRIIALARAGWKKEDITSDAHCALSTVNRVIRETIEEGKMSGKGDE